MLIKDSIFVDTNDITFLNTFGVITYIEVMHNMLNVMADDLSKLTGINKELILLDYVNNCGANGIHDAIIEVMKRNGTYNKELSKSSIDVVIENMIKGVK